MARIRALQKDKVIQLYLSWLATLELVAITSLASSSFLHISFSPADGSETDSRWKQYALEWSHILRYGLDIFQPPPSQVSAHSNTSLFEVLK